MVDYWIVKLNFILIILFTQAPFQFGLSQSATTPPDAVTIEYFAPFKTARECAQYCLSCDLDRHCDVGNNFGCPTPHLNSCYCRSDLRASAYSAIADCVNYMCSSNSVDVADAQSIYSSYCVRQIGPVTTTSSGAAATTATVTTTVTSGSESRSIGTTGEKSSKLALVTLHTLAILMFPAIISWITH